MVTISTSNRRSRGGGGGDPHQNMESAQRFVVFCVAILILLLALVNQSENAETIMISETSSSLSVAATTTTTTVSPVFDTTYQEDDRPNLSQWEGCTIDNHAITSQPKILKAFWVPMYPNSDGGIVGHMIRLLTNSPAGHKNYYASMPGLKKCKSKSSVTISCEQIHPVVGIGPPPEMQTARYQKKVLLGMRHPLTGIPAHHHAKAVKYHGATAQVDIDSWRSFRDRFFIDSVHDSWRHLLATWKELGDGGGKYYDPEPFYLPYEHLLDVTKGPALTEQLASILRTAGYNVVATNNTGCVWYHAVRKRLQQRPMTTTTAEPGQQQQQQQQPLRHPHYDYADSYIPSLTREQKIALIDELNDIRKAYPTDLVLNELLAEYITTVQNDPRVDTPWVNQTITTSSVVSSSGDGERR